MSYIGDLSSYIASIAGNTSTPAPTSATNASDMYGLNMEDFLSLMVAELTNQSIDSTADTSEMINQMVQMQMVTALVNMTDASVMSYAASLVGKEVTVGNYDSEGNFQQLVGTVTATGSYGDEQVVFVNGKMYYLSEIMAVGNLNGLEFGEGETDETEEAESVDYDWMNMTTEEIDEAVSGLSEEELGKLTAAINNVYTEIDWESMTEEQSESLGYLIFKLTGEYPGGETV